MMIMTVVLLGTIKIILMITILVIMIHNGDNAVENTGINTDISFIEQNDTMNKIKLK